MKEDLWGLTKDAAKGLFRFCLNRVVWLGAALCVLFVVLVVTLFRLQILDADGSPMPPPNLREVAHVLDAPRGNIYDRFGRPLAINITSYTVTMNPVEVISNEALLALTRIFERNEEDFIQTFPMTDVWPYAFTLGTPAREYRWKSDMDVPYPTTATAAEAWEHIVTQFRIDPTLSHADKRRILNFRAEIYAQRYRRQIFPIAFDVSLATIAAIEEQRGFFAGVEIVVSTQRYYPQSLYFAHLLGYTNNDMVGQTGLELFMDEWLRGQPGLRVYDIDRHTGRRAGTPPRVTPPVPGNDIFLTIDLEQQIEMFYLLRDYLVEITARRLTMPREEEPLVYLHVLLAHMLRHGWIPVSDILNAPAGSPVFVLRRYVMDRTTPDARDDASVLAVLLDGVLTRRITPYAMLLAMVELGVLTDTDNFSARVRSFNGTAQSFIAEKLRLNELSPRMLGLDPFGWSVVVVDVHSGALLASVSYPSFDINRLANRMDATYLHRLNADPTAPATNRPFHEAVAPGSTFKMITAVAGLESGVLTPTTTIFDNRLFRAAGFPYARCWNRWGCGHLCVARAIAVSCNYFFYETAWRLNTPQNPRQSIETMNRYMAFFGLNERSGIEIGERIDNMAHLPYRMASPQFKYYLARSRNEFAPRDEWVWTHGDTIRTAIGQSYNLYTAAQMARYMMIIANRGERYPLFMVDSVRCPNGRILLQTVPESAPSDIVISDMTWDAVHDGMIRTTTMQGATGTRHFAGFPIPTAGKTGTAELTDRRLSHTAFGGFAPFDNPQIALYVVIPFGATTVLPGAAANLGRDVVGAFLTPNPSEVVPMHQPNTLRR